MWKRILIYCGVALVLFFIMNNVIMPWYVKHSDTAKAPNVIGMNFIQAKKIIEEAGLEIKQGDIRYDENKPIGEILDQNPPGGDIVKYGRRIYVTICGGEQLVEVPNLKGRSLRDAKFTLEQRNLKLGETVRKNTNEFPEDIVISQIIQPGSKVKRNTSIDLILSNGPSIGDLKVPNVVGKKLEEAKKIILESKLKLGKITYQTNNEIPVGQIIDQYPLKDKSANENTAVDLFVARKKPVIQYEKSDSGDSRNNNLKKEKEPEKKKEDLNKNEKPTDEKKNPPTDKSQDKKIPPVKKEEKLPDKEKKKDN